MEFLYDFARTVFTDRFTIQVQKKSGGSIHQSIIINFLQNNNELWQKMVQVIEQVFNGKTSIFRQSEN